MKVQQNLLTRLLRSPISHTPWVLLLTTILLVVATIGGKNLYFRGDYNIFFDGANPQLQAFEEIQATFNKTDNLAIVIAPADGNVFTPETLNLVRDFTEDSWQVPFSSRVDSLSNYQHTEAFEDDLLVEDLLLEDYELTQERIEKVKQVALSEPVLLKSVVSESGDVTIVNITLQLPKIDETAELIQVVAFADQLLAKYQAQYPSVTFHKAGIVAMNDAFMVSAQNDTSTLVPAMLAVVLVFLTIMLRSFLSVVATLVVIIGSVTATMGLSGWAGMFLSTATVNIPTLVLTLAVADCVHVIATMRQAMLEGKSKSEAISHSIWLNFMPILITSVTTAIGFLMMNMSDSPVLRDFGNLAALGVMIACILSVTLLPALLKVLPIKVKPQAQNKATYMDKFGAFVVRQRKVLLPLSVAVIAVSAALVPQNKINDESVKYFDQTSAFRQAADFMEEHISGMTNINIAIKTGESQGIADPTFLTTLGEFTDWLRAQPETDHVASLADVYKRLNKNMHGDDQSYYTLPQERELAAQYLLMYEMSLPYGLDLNNQINVDKSSVKLVLTTRNLGSKELVDIENRIYDWFATNAPQYDISASSPTLMFAHIGETNMASMLSTLPITLILISALMIFALRSFRLGVISLVPNMAPAVIGFGMWALYSGEINLGLSVVVTLTLGIVVDDAVHFLSKYQRARKEGKDAEQAVRYAFNTVGRALGITTVVLVAGFSILAMSSFRLNADMGQLSALVIFLALVVDFLFLPTLLMLFDKDKAPAEDTKEAISLNKTETVS
ncbi:putative exporter of the RND superfamily [Vibrio nigripulchritudo SFn27]|uniref:Putative exporter of the RND superfamily n=1 Tax=Vibrio nigripulchritudo TaxID=28173 RepID=U4KEY1_9VIBR|nr:MMPL family transporter [Vibrio nigripulchritudo]CCN85734.1 putative exporter of the RND superfamily [Vibrio nigripulchritudo BLFn1]CCN86712.1 putative exporter of the RND superfamily [Vibrio nigripulchritudo SFn27]CCN95998.1 putative exporter of the RND superfamily [Vibrio nigripulchritudo ENn2]CCO43329.1 putative exporter of the RND superfamily [Vibrio nigripulchritudo SFn135]CCO53676.1 putative exporter of the RND superfamily [Vibrio nigripulchritudo Wn13]